MVNAPGPGVDASARCTDALLTPSARVIEATACSPLRRIACTAARTRRLAEAAFNDDGCMAKREPHEVEPMLTPADVAAPFAVDPKTVTRWVKTGKLQFITTHGGHRRYREADVRALLEQLTEQPRA